ncbi:arylesterase, partial [bacterium]|nr:arylesterase [bacterium]
LGDSLAAAYGVKREEGFVPKLQTYIIKAGLDYEVVNAGVSGDTTAGGLRRINWLLKKKVDVLLLELGGNDGLRGISPVETQKNLLGIIDKTRTKYPNVKIILTGMQMPPNMGREFTKAFAQVFTEVAKIENITLVPFLLEGIASDPKYNLPDLIHPNPAGHDIVAANVWKTLKTVIAN